MYSPYSIEITVKERCDNHKVIIDKYKGSPEEIITYLNSKYVTKKNFLSKMYKALIVTEAEMKKIMSDEDE